MDPQDDSMAKSTKPLVTLTKDQLVAIFGEDPALTAGQTYEVSLVAGEPAEGGSQDFTVDSVGGMDGDDMPPENDEPDAEPNETLGEGDGESSSPEETEMLGYDRKKLEGQRKNTFPKFQ